MAERLAGIFAQSALRVAAAILVLAFAGCSGLPVPEGHVWQVGPNEADLAAYFSSKLPASPKAFEAFLESEQFNCAAWTNWTEAKSIPGNHQHSCFYSARGPRPGPGANAVCVSGLSLTLQVTFDDGQDLVHDFDLREIAFLDQSAHGSGLCLAL
jgi:hypothetical protein